uniref:Arrestin C-terminal-like domain-containing protein n=1 Tax=Heliothis virescens TaxID=7102 RepID=A0A2A4K6V2_HELVI
MAGGAFNNAVIRLDNNPTGIFYSGQLIEGSVIFYLEHPIKFSVICMQFLGEANSFWTETEIETVNGVEKHKLIKYVGREEYFNSNVELAGGSGAGVSHLPAHGQDFPFKFLIPSEAPSSFKGERGEVVYSMTANLIFADPSLQNESVTKNFQVVAPFDLNMGSPKIRQPINLEFEEVYGCDCFCSPDPMNIRVSLPISGYCPGQVIPVSFEVDNQSSVEITKITFQLFSKELYRSHRPQSEYIMPENILVTEKKGPVLGHSKRNFTYDLKVPDMIPPFLENCGIIDVGYFFRVIIKLSGCNDELQDEAEICLGLVPLREFTQSEYVHPMADQLPIGPIPDRGRHALAPPPVASDFRGSNNSLQKVQYNPAESSYPTNPQVHYNPQNAYPNSPPPYPGVSYPTGNSFQAPVSIEMKPRPYQDYNIGFKAEGAPYPSSVPGGSPPSYMSAVPQPPYPMANVMPGGHPPYPTGHVMPGVHGAPSHPTPYPTGGHSAPQSSYPGAVPGGNSVPPYGQGGYTPSAPPPTD